MNKTCSKIKKKYKVSVLGLCGLYLLVNIQTVSTLNTTGCTTSKNIQARGMTVPRNLHRSFGDFSLFTSVVDENLSPCTDS